MAKNKGQENLIPITERTEEERKAIASKGGKAKAEKEKQRKVVAETFKAILDMEINTPTFIEFEHDYKTGEGMYLNLEGHSLLTHMCADIVHDAIMGYGAKQNKAREIILRYIEPLE